MKHRFVQEIQKLDESISRQLSDFEYFNWDNTFQDILEMSKKPPQFSLGE